MNTNEIIKSMIAVSIAIVIFAMVLVPMIQSANDQTKDGEDITASNSAPTSYLDLATETITVSIDSGTVTSSYTKIYTSGFVATITAGASGSVSVTAADGTSISVTESLVIVPSTGAVTIDDTTTMTVTANQVYVNGSSTSAYGLYTPTENSPIYVETSVSVMLIGSTHIAVQKVTASSTDFTVTAAQAVDDDDMNMKGVYEVTDVSESSTTGKSMIAPISYTYTEQVAAMDDNMKAIMDVIPILVAIGLLLAAVGMFINKRA